MAAREYGPLRAAVTIVSTVIYTASSLAAVPLVWLLVIRLRTSNYDAALGWGLALLGLLLLVVIWFIVAGVLNVLMDSAEELARLHRTTRAVSDRQAQMLADTIERLDGLAHWTAMSEATRGLLARQRETSVFVRQIESAIGEGEWAEAERLIDLFADHFADPAGAGLLRQKMVEARDMAHDRDVRARIGEVRGLIDEHNFPSAEMALGRLAKDYPGDRRLDDLRATLLRARRRHSEACQEKFRQLLAEQKFQEASVLLEQMTWIDAEVIGELREQFKDALRQAQHEAREAFAAAVKDKHWARAAELGQHILHHFPETAMAGEVRKVIDMVQQRARAESPPAARPAQPTDTRP